MKNNVSCLTWIHKLRSNNLLISGLVLKFKVKQFAQQFGITDFKAYFRRMT